MLEKSDFLNSIDPKRAFAGQESCTAKLRRYLSATATIGGPKRRGLVPVLLRTVMEADAEHVASLLAELGYPSNEADIRNRLRHRLHSQTSCFLLAQSASEVIGFVSAELVPYFPNGSTICRVTALIVSINHRGRRVGERLLSGAADFARGHHCSGIEITSAEHRIEAHRFYQRVGFTRTSFRFFQAL